MTPQLNYTGAAIFWLYILFALIFTSIAVQTILSLPPSSSTSSSNAKPTPHILTFTLLAFLSFTVLSYNMLSVLIQSFGLWTAANPPIAETAAAALASTLPFPPILALAREIYTWSTESTLFTDFGLAIVSSKVRNFWTTAALLMTLYQSFFMAIKGREHRVPKLWVFFGIAQILPVSFAQNLFYLAVLRGRRRNEEEKTTVGGFETIVLCEVYFWVVKAVAPWVAGKKFGMEFGGVQVLIWTILGARAMLGLPFFMVENEGRGFRVGPKEIGRGILWQGFMTFTLDYGWLILDPGLLRDIRLALFEHPAVSALGMDFILSVVSLGAWNCLVNHDSSMPDVGRAKQEVR